MKPVKLTRGVKIPDTLRISRYLRAPEIGPRILFFSGGTALNQLSSVLKNYTHNSIHLVTPFDSGGSSAILRKAFEMPAIGDLRSRLMALADESITGYPAVIRLFTYRFPMASTNSELMQELEQINSGQHYLISNINNPVRQLICDQLTVFLQQMPSDFDLRGASIGNLILAGGYLDNNRQMDPIVFLFSKLVGVRGTVRNLINENLHLGVELDDGTVLLGQHRLTGKEVAPIESPIKRLFLSKDLDVCSPVTTTLHEKSRGLITAADLIVYPPGSFYTSLLANLLPNQVSTTIANNHCPKVYIPNLCVDPEQIGKESDQLIQALLEQLHHNAPANCTHDQLLNFLLVDLKNGNYPGSFDPALLQQYGIQLIDTPLITKRSAPWYDAELLVSALLSLI